MLNIGIVGGTGYTGVELMRLLAAHPEVSVEVITSRSNAGTRVADVFPNLRGRVELVYTKPGQDSYKNCDLVFFATPNTIAMTQAETLLADGIKLIDLAADFRIKDIATWEKWYGATHACPSLVEQAVYGLPELNRDTIKDARLVANPGCYPTAVILALLPLLKNDLIDPSSIIADCKSGASGAGRSASIATGFCELTESVKAYAVGGHRHLPEIKAILQTVNTHTNLVFTPHLMPMIRGIHATVYADAQGSDKNPQEKFEEFYQEEPFVDVMPAGSHPETRSVKGANHCQIAVHYLAESNKYVVLSVIDNLVKGAAGQAIQNMNLMSGFNESTGLEALGMIP
ncbi:MAG: N-acetyl-gamma-glutamyl-phosphate reductase [Gammaproteobacteria bacterium]|nr:MAG: N-acetyl-gamma-glutamyl-phosphate reductase [Gammaproteobacteria bacterium]